MNNYQSILNDVIAMLQTLDIKAEYVTMSKLVRCMEELAKVRDGLEDWQPIPQKEEEKTQDAESKIVSLKPEDQPEELVNSEYEYQDGDAQ